MSTPEQANAGYLTIEEFLSLSNARCAVLGRPIAHSLSPQLHTAGYRALGLETMSYYRVEAGESKELRRLMDAASATAGIRGFSVTMPGKQAALELADTATERAINIGAANTLVPQFVGEPMNAPIAIGAQKNESSAPSAGSKVEWLADNTDVDGVARCLEHVVATGAPSLQGTSAVVIGNGGTARPAVAALAAAGVAQVTVLARSERALNLQSLVESFGMEFSWFRFDDVCLAANVRGASVTISTVPAEAVEPLLPALLDTRAIVDVIYEPYPTPLLSAAREAGIPHADGLRMLAGQAEEQFRLFTGYESPSGLMLDTVLQEKGF